MVRIDIHPAAFNEIRGAKIWYNEKSEGLGDRFILALDHGMTCVREHPETGKLIL